MSERLSNERIDDFVDFDMPGYSDLSRVVREMAIELRSRRALDLTAEEVEALCAAGDLAFSAPLNGIGMAKVQRASAVLDRLIGARP